MSQKKLKYWLIPLGVLVVLLLSLNTILESVAKGYIQNKLQMEEKDGAFELSFADIDLNIFTEKLKLTGLKLQPKQKPPVVSDSSQKGGVGYLSIDQASLHGIGLSNFLWNSKLAIKEINLDSVDLVILKGDPGEKEQKVPAPEKEGLVIDSLKLPGIEGISLGSFSVKHFASLVLDTQSKDTVSGFQSSDISLQGMALKAAGPEDSNTFVPYVEDLEIRLGSQDYVLASGLYALHYEGLVYQQRGQLLKIDNFSFRPQMVLDSFASRNKYSYERYDASIGSIAIRGIELKHFLESGSLHIRSVSLDSITADIFKDKTKPLDRSKIKPFITQKLGEMKLAMKIDTVSLANSYLSYYERLPDTDNHVEVSFSNMNGAIVNVYSAGYTGDAKEPLTLQLETDLLDAIHVGLQMQMSYDSDAFSMKGRTDGTSKLMALNPTVYPAMNMRFQKGRLNSIQFQARGNSRRMKGTLTMLYSDLEVELFKADHKEDKTLSWLANGLVKHSNPNRRGKVIVGEIEVERDLNKGAMNYVWKGVQSGVMNTFNPLGKRRSQ